MLYLLRCDVCRKEIEVGVPVAQHDSVIKPGIRHEGSCPGTFRQVITRPRTVFGREGFPKHGHEVAIPTADHEFKSFRDKVEAREWLGERGLMSKYIENDM